MPILITSGIQQYPFRLLLFSLMLLHRLLQKQPLSFSHSPSSQLQLHQAHHSILCILQNFGSPDSLLSQLFLRKGQFKPFDHPLPDALQEMQIQLGTREGHVKLRLQEILEGIQLGLLYLASSFQLYGKQCVLFEAFQRVLSHKSKHQPSIPLLLPQFEMDLWGLYLVESRMLVDLRVILPDLTPDPGSGYLLQCLAFEVELRLGIDDLINQFQVGQVSEVGIGFVSGRDGEDLAIEFALDDGADVVVGPTVTFQLGHFSSFEFLFETGVVHLMGELEQSLDVPLFAREGAVQGGLACLHGLELADVALVLQATAFDVARLSSIEHFQLYSDSTQKEIQTQGQHNDARLIEEA